MAKMYDDLIIDIALDEPSRSSPALGQIDRLLQQSALETQSLQVVRRMMVRDMLGRAQVNGVSKLTAAANMRRQLRRELPPPAFNGVEAEAPRVKRVYTKRQKKGLPKPHRVMGTHERGEMAKVAIVGPRLNLWILENLNEATYTTGNDIIAKLRATRLADHIQRLSGVYGLLSMEGLVKHAGKDGYKLTAKGRGFAAKLRQRLEHDGECVPGSYLAPATYSASGKRTPIGFKSAGARKT